MAGYIGSKSSVTLVDGYTEAEADAEFVTKTGDTMSGNLDVTGTVTADGLTVDGLVKSDTASNGFRVLKGSGAYYGELSVDYISTDVFTYVDSIAGASFNGSVKIRTANNGGSVTDRVKINSSGVSFYEDTGTTAKFFWDASAESLGIGTSSPTLPLDIVSNSGADAIKIRARPNGNDYGTLTFYNNAGTTKWADIQSNVAKDLRFYTNGGSERMRIDSSGNVRLANTSMAIDNSGNTATGLSVASTGVTHIATSGNNTSLVIQRVSDTGTDNAIFFLYGTTGVGSVTVNSSSTAYNTSSDYRLKENVVDLIGASARVNQLNPSRFNFIADADTTVDGFLAHEVATVVPEAITGTKDAMRDEEYEVTPAVLDEDGNVTTEAVMGTRSVPDYQGIDQSKLVPLLTAALQEALTEIASLKTRVEALEA